MKPEIEIQFFPRGNPTDDFALLARHGFTLTLPRTLMKRKMFDHPHRDQSLRVRHEGQKVTMTTKRLAQKGAIDGRLEAEVVVKNFEDAERFLEALGYPKTKFYENYCTRWEDIDGTEISFSEWPGIPGYFEIEGDNAEAVYAVLEDVFGISRNDPDIVLAGSASDLYERAFGMPKDAFRSFEVITFEKPPKWPR